MNNKQRIQWIEDLSRRVKNSKTTSPVHGQDFELWLPDWPQQPPELTNLRQGVALLSLGLLLNNNTF